MALIQANFISKSLFRTVTINVILPVDRILLPGMVEREEKPFKTLYLLHGIFGNYTDWVSGTNIQRWAEEKGLAVVMPSGDNAFYLDNPLAQNNYGEFIGKELVEVTRKMFHLSHKREDTYIAGLSMGGYGALRNGLKYNDTFGYIAALSAGLILDNIDKRTNDSEFFLERRSFVEEFFGDLTKVENSDKNPKWLLKDLIDKKANIPNIYMACGEQDHLIEANRDFRNYVEKLGLDITYEEGPGGHEWDFWNRYIKKVVDWLPLEGSDAGINSGNIGR